VYNALKAIEKPDGSLFKPLSHDAESKHGFSTHAAIFDELHTYRNNELIDTITTSLASREQPLMIYVTTSDFERENSPCNERHDYASAVRDGALDDPEFLPVIYEATKEDDWKDPEVWKKANPNFGISVGEKFLASECKKAQNTPSYQNTFKRLYLNIRTDQDIQWISMADWNKCNDASIDLRSLVGQPCYTGVDLAATTDLCAVVHLFPTMDWTCLCRFFVPRLSAEKRKEKNRVKYLEWAEQGFLELTSGNVVDYEVIRESIRTDATLYDVQEIAIDRWNSTQMQTWLTDDGFDVVPYGQGFASMSAPTKELEKRAISGDLNHMDNPVLRWCVNNVSIEEDAAGNIKPSKGKSTEKIDGAVALIMAIGRAMCSNTQTSVYEERGLVVI